MDPKLYQAQASRTECDQQVSRERMYGGAFIPFVEGHSLDMKTPIRLNHAIIGLAGEVGELASAIQKWVYYGGKLDVINIAEELGDICWYIAEACNALGLDMGKVMEANIAKLRSRYPEKFTTELAAENGRDRGREANVLEAKLREEVGGVPHRRTRAEVLKLRGTIEGCCERYVNHMACNCLEDICDGQWDDSNVPPGDRSGS